MKKYFQSIYNETGIKPFTFMHAALCILIPILVFFLVGMNVSSGEGEAVIIWAIGSLLVCWGIDVFLIYRSFKDKVVKIFIFHVLASIAFWSKLILIPLFKICWQAGMAVFHANNGNTTASINSSRRMGAAAASNKKSAFNWFEYEGKVHTDDNFEAELLDDFSADEGAYSAEQNNEARAKGYKNAKHAEMSGEKIE